MSRRATGVLAGAVLAMVVATAPAQASSGINAYRFKATAKTVEKLAQAGFDVTEGRRSGGKHRGLRHRSARWPGSPARTRSAASSSATGAGARPSQRSVRMVRRGLAEDAAPRSLKQAGDPTAARQRRRLQGLPQVRRRPGRRPRAVHGDVRPDRRPVPDITEKVVLGKTEWGRDIIAMQVTRNATGADNGKPAVLYNAMQHAREWLAGETCKRTLDYFTRLYGKDRQVTRLVNERQLWFVCVSNPDGYEFTFTEGNRLWRKNLHEQNGTPGIQNGDGVDPNRNFPVNWGLDNEGSSPDLASETYRGPSAASEPETKAMLKLWEMVPFVFQKNDHTAAELILYPQGWQQYTPSADDPIFPALAGDDEDPAIQGFDPDLGAELYITNGDTLDTAYNRKNILAYTPEGSEPHSTTVSGFEFEDVEGQIENEFRDHLPFILDLAESADDPDNPDSHLGNTVDDYYVDSFAVLLRRPADGAGARQARPRRRHDEVPRSTAGPRPPRRRRSGATASATTRRPAGSTTASAASWRGRTRATPSRSGSRTPTASASPRRSPTRPGASPRRRTASGC